jgi:hypothetical protein
VGDLLNYRVRKVTTIGSVSTIAGSNTSGTTDGIATLANMCAAGVNVDSNLNIYVAGWWTNLIRKITSGDIEMLKFQLCDDTCLIILNCGIGMSSCAAGQYFTGSECAYTPAGRV